MKTLVNFLEQTKLKMDQRAERRQIVGRCCKVISEARVSVCIFNVSSEFCGSVG